MKSRMALLPIIIMILISGCSVEKSTTPQSDSSSNETINSLDTSSSEDSTLTTPNTLWIPDGFNDWDGNIAWKWVDRSSDCGDCVYWHVQVISNLGCPNGIYASINIERNDEVIDWTNDTLPYLGPNQKAVLTFEKYGLSGSGSNYQGSLTELNCR